MNNYLLLIPIAIVLIFIIIIIVYLVKRSKANDEQPSSILGVNDVGVPSSADFSYGYEKEETVVMNPIDVDNESTNENNHFEQTNETPLADSNVSEEADDYNNAQSHVENGIKDDEIKVDTSTEENINSDVTNEDNNTENNNESEEL